MQPQQKYFLGNHLERKLRFKVESALHGGIMKLNLQNYGVYRKSEGGGLGIYICC